MIGEMRQRLNQLESRLKKVVFRHKEVHSKCFPKDGSDGVYKKSTEVSYDTWEKHPLNLYMSKSTRVIAIIRREMLAIIYYLKIRETRQGINSLTSNTSGTINKYRYLFDGYDGKLDLNPLYPKTEDEIIRIKMTRLEKMRAFPKEQDYSMFTQQGNLLVNDMMIALIEMLEGERKVTQSDFQEALEVFTNNLESVGHGEVYDTAVREVVLSILESEIKRAGYNFSVDM